MASPENKNGDNVWNRPEIADFIQNGFHWIIIGSIILSIIFIIFIILGIIGRGALIASIEKHIQEKPADFHSGIKDGKNNFWKIFMIILSLGLFIFLTIAILSAPVIFLFLNHDYIFGIFMGILALAIAAPLIILAAYLKIYGCLYAVLGKLNFWPAIENSYNLFLKNISSSIIMSLIFIPLHIFLMLLIFMVFIPIVIIFAAIGFIFFLIAGKIGAIIIVIFGLLVLFAICIYILSFYEAFSQAVWVLFFHEIAKTKAPELIAEPELEAKPIGKPAPIIELTKK